MKGGTMIRKKCLKSALLLASFFSFVLLSAHAEEPVRPHIVLFIADDLGLDVAPCHSASVRMPNLESICETSRVYERAYTHPYCTASRATMMTGRHPFRHGANDVKQSAQKLQLSEVTFPEILKSLSDTPYLTAGFGKWHLADDGNGSLLNPNLQGFDYFEGNPRQHHTYKYFDYDWHINGTLVGQRPVYKTTQIANSAIKYFQLVPDHIPQFMMLSFTNPHKPFHAPPETLHSYGELPELNLRPTLSETPEADQYRVNRREPRFDPYYFAMLEALDTEIWRITGTLSTATKRPIVFIFIGDNGSAGEVFASGSMDHVRSKATLYDGGVRVPMMVWTSHPEEFPLATGRGEQLVHLADLFSTIIELSTLGQQSQQNDQIKVDASSILADLLATSQDRTDKREFVFLERGNKQSLPFAYAGVDQSGLKLILRETERQTNYSSGVLIELYDTETDPSEIQNLIHTPCEIEKSHVWDLFNFIVSKTTNTASNPWFQQNLYHAELQKAFERC
ncbi:sulfatase-like hydrolase/transferase [Hyphomonas sp. FCG-A18]|uniref:sulfatase-like hydrolase/transferase n=1 Tax=Hyphomonas sp. FCG-A18 TaxID=3080019 RepID=UPI002B301F30|nr:sulfatase-like hydrolase/transferase [Hyphomonas sp. FCG-A18]